MVNFDNRKILKQNKNTQTETFKFYSKRFRARLLHWGEGKMGVWSQMGYGESYQHPKIICKNTIYKTIIKKLQILGCVTPQ